MKLLLASLILLSSLVACSQARAQDVCYSQITESCEQVQTDVQLSLDSQYVAPGVFRIANHPERRLTTTITLDVGTFTAEPVSTATSFKVATGTNQAVFSTEGAYFIDDLRILAPDLVVTDEITAIVRVVDPNAGVSLVYEGRVLLAKIGGVENKFVPFFNPAVNTTQQSLLRFVNTSAQEGRVYIRGVDDAGVTTETVTIDIAPGVGINVLAVDLEVGNVAKRITGSFGTGTGRWRLYVSTDFPGLVLQALVRNNATGTITTASDVIE